VENFKWFGREFEFSKLTGIVISNNKFSETNVSGGGNVTATQVHSSATTVHEFWVRDEAGKEHPINMRGIDVPLALGQKITLILSGFVGKNSYYVLLINHNADKHWHLFSGKDFVNFCLQSEQSMSKFLIKAVIAIALYILMLNLTSGYITLAIHLGLIYYCVNWYRSRAKRAKEFDAHLTNIAQSL
jgi:hypothetical protein